MAVTLDEVVDGCAVTRVYLDATARIPGLSEAGFQEVAEATRKTCLISSRVTAGITMEPKLA